MKKQVIAKGIPNISTNWCIQTKDRYLNLRSVKRTRTECISEFLRHWSVSWEFLKRKYGYRCVKVKVTVEPLTNNEDGNNAE